MCRRSSNPQKASRSQASSAGVHRAAGPPGRAGDHGPWGGRGHLRGEALAGKGAHGVGEGESPVPQRRRRGPDLAEPGARRRQHPGPQPGRRDRAGDRRGRLGGRRGGLDRRARRRSRRSPGMDGKRRRRSTLGLATAAHQEPCGQEPGHEGRRTASHGFDGTSTASADQGAGVGWESQPGLLDPHALPGGEQQVSAGTDVHRRGAVAEVDDDQQAAAPHPEHP